jgi:hypothetical protein
MYEPATFSQQNIWVKKVKINDFNTLIETIEEGASTKKMKWEFSLRTFE